MSLNSEKKIETQILMADIAGIQSASRLLKKGKLIAFPTETVYGLGADATNKNAVKNIYLAKGRPSINPLIIHVKSLAQAKSLAYVPKILKPIIDIFWPGPLTLVLERKINSDITGLVSSGLTTIALRNPNHSIAQKLLIELGRPIAAPSANLSGKITNTRASDVFNGLNGKIDAIIDGGICPIGIESTIISAKENIVTILRPGAISYQEIMHLVGKKNIQKFTTSANIQAPGQLASHYAPETPLRLNADHPHPEEVFLSYGPLPKNTFGFSLSEKFDLHEVAMNLFSTLHDIDKLAMSTKAKAIAVAKIPTSGIGYAINDRLARAAHGNNLK